MTMMTPVAARATAIAALNPMRLAGRSRKLRSELPNKAQTAMHGMFNIFRFPDDAMPDVVYSEALTSATYLNKPEETTQYTEALDRMAALAATPDQTVTILRETLKEH